jgi:hypothetical protein
MYILCKNENDALLSCVIKHQDLSCIPFDPANTDYQQFKKDVLEGASGSATSELQDADGNVMTQEEAVAFINELP